MNNIATAFFIDYDLPRADSSVLPGHVGRKCVELYDKLGRILLGKNTLYNYGTCPDIGLGFLHMSVLQLQDHPSPHRKRILRWMFRNYSELLRFYLFGGRLARLPVIGPFLARPMLSEYGFVLHGGMALPLIKIHEIIDQAQDIVAAECPCRALTDK